MNIEEARQAVESLREYAAGSSGEDSAKYLHIFIDEVEYLLKHNSIKQTPALFKEKK